jgi:hypothetical protein
MQQTVSPQRAPISPVVTSGAATQEAVVAGTPAPVAVDRIQAAEIYQGLRAQRRILGDQLEQLQSTRRDLVNQVRTGPVSDADRAGLEQQIAQVDQRIGSVSIQIAETDAQVAASAAVPGAVIEQPRPNPWESGPPEEIVALAIGMTALLLLPIVLAWARRIWRKSAAPPPLPREFSDRMSALERSIDSVAIEVERIGEGQRFVTQLLAERADVVPAALLAGANPDASREGPR